MSSTPGGHHIHLLGRPRIDGPPGNYQMRSRKSWALLAYLLLAERPPTRSHLAALLFEEADDPLRTLRWGLFEIRRALAGHATIHGDPVILRRDGGIVVDVGVIASGGWVDAVRLPALGSELLEGLTLRGGAVFDSWLLAEQRRVAVASQRMLHDAALASMDSGAFRTAIGYAVRLVAMAPLDETGHALLVQLYRIIGDDIGAQRQYDTCARLLAADLGTLPGSELRAALRVSRPRPAVRGVTHVRSYISPTRTRRSALHAAGRSQP